VCHDRWVRSVAIRSLAPYAALLAALALAAPALAAAPRGQRLASAPASPSAATAAFGLRLLHVLGPGNLAFSPDSIATALAMAGSGARGSTAAQIASTIGVGSPAAFGAVGALQNTIAAEQRAAANGSSEAPTLDLADALFLQQGFALEPGFLTGLSTHFATPAPLTVDFEHAPAAAAAAINAWVSEHTQGIIPAIVGEMEPSTRLALANAIYLKASWLDPFKTSETAPAAFHAGAHTSTVPFMHESDTLPYGRGRGYAALELPYAASTLSLMVVLPIGQNVAALERSLSSTGLARVARGLSARGVDVSLPRFHLKLQRELDAPLERLGMTDAFSARANFSGIMTSTPLQIGKVIHGADLKVDEQGTVAAAATVVEVEATAERSPIHPVAFDANRPFLFFLRDDRSGAVLFAGRLATPEE